MAIYDHLFCFGLNYRTATIERREIVQEALGRLLSDPHWRQVLARYGAPSFDELAVVQTCNRFEIYGFSAEPAGCPFDLLFTILSDLSGRTPTELAASIYTHRGRAAINHLCRVAAGLDSMVLGEPQILGQVARAAEMAAERGTIGRHLQRLFRRAIRSGKRARSETAISQNHLSISSIAVLTAAEMNETLQGEKIAVVGLGLMGLHTLKTLQARGLRGMHLVNRTHQRAIQLAEAYGGRAVEIAALPDILVENDLVFCVTAAARPILTVEMVAAAASARGGRPLVLVDLGLPRNVAPDAARIPGITLIDIDRLRTELDGSLAARTGEIPAVEAIVEEEAAACVQELEALVVHPLIAGWRERAETIRRREVQRALAHLGEVDDQVLGQIEHLSRALVNKLLHEPTVRLRSKSGSTEIDAYTDVVRHLFDLTPPDETGTVEP